MTPLSCSELHIPEYAAELDTQGQPGCPRLSGHSGLSLSDTERSPHKACRPAACTHRNLPAPDVKHAMWKNTPPWQGGAVRCAASPTVGVLEPDTWAAAWPPVDTGSFRCD